MSFPKSARKVQSYNGNSGSGPTGEDPLSFNAAVAAALRSSFGSGTSAMKTISIMTGANERAVKNWYQARNAPSAYHLVALARHSDDILRLVLTMARREGVLISMEFAVARGALSTALAAMDEAYT
jgi:hypothetical protein